MSHNCRLLCSKLFLILYNLIFWICGIGILVLGYLVLYDEKYTHVYTILYNQQPEKFPLKFLYYAAYTLIGFGVLVILGGFVGFCGTIRNSKCMLGTYIFFLTFLSFMALLLSLGLIYRHLTIPPENNNLKEKFSVKYNAVEHQNYTRALDYVQVSFQCCGVNGPDDYLELSQEQRIHAEQIFPPTCCVLSEDYKIERHWLEPIPRNSIECQNQNISSSRHSHGCWKELENVEWRYTLIIIGTSLIFAVAQVIGILFSICLIQKISPADADQ